MKIQGPGKPGGVAPTEETKGTGFAEKIEGGGPSGPDRPDPIAALAREVQSGAITPREAVDRIVEMAASRGAALPPTAREKLLEQLQSMLKEDPFLAAKAKRVGVDE
jgi:hypothetical protein